jgi:hypothetical protein
MSTALNELSKAIYGALTAGTALTSMLSGTASVYRSQAPADTAYDYVIFNLQGGGPTLQTAHQEIDDLIAVKCYSITSPSRAGSLSTLADALLDGVTLTLGSGWLSINTRREQDLELVENLPTGQIVYMSGGIYRCSLAK